MDGLLTAVNLKKRGVNIDALCLCYEKESELISHSLIKCDITRKVWDCWSDCPVEITSSLLDFFDLAMEIMAQGTSQDLEYFLVMAWSIWYNRNQVVHKFACQSFNQIWSFAKRYLQDYKEAFTPSSHYKSYDGNRWLAPLAGMFKINVDEATLENGRNSSVLGTFLCNWLIF